MRFGASRQSGQREQAYRELLEALVTSEDPQPLLTQLGASVATSGLSQKHLAKVNADAFARYAEHALAGDILTTHQFVCFGETAKVLGVAVSPLMSRRALVAAVNGGLLPMVETPRVMTELGESVHYEVPSAQLMKEEDVREFQGASRGVSVRIARGVRISSGSFRGHSVVTGKRVRAADTGCLSVTSHRTIFLGRNKTIVMPHNKLVGLDIYWDGAAFHLSNISATQLFTGFPGDVLAAYVNVAAQRHLARTESGKDEATALADAATRLEEAVRAAQSPGASDLDFEAFVATESTRSGLAPEALRDYLGKWATERAAELDRRNDELKRTLESQ